MSSQQITDIKQQAKRPERYSIYIEGRYEFSLSESDLIAQSLHKGQTLTAEQIASLKATSSLGKAYDRVLNYVTLRPRSIYEIKQYLQRRQYGNEIINTIIERLQKLELLDDAQFARSWVEWRQSVSPRSRRRLRAELMQKRIAPELIDEVLDEISDHEQLQSLQALIARKRSRYSDQQKLLAYLARQGYPYDLIKQALDEA